ncbi:MAG: DNA mismatch repair endonuclease MutH [Gammaproteobacteria bacterium]|nr:DNA mismatch repair endonuclease MutH [Gammaproteobacteria bacterium]
MDKLHTTPPCDITQLEQRAWQMAGQTIGSLAKILGSPIPKDLKHAKGWQGQLIESYLGATASSQAAPDFMGLGIELKTLPLGHDGSPKESTYVCTVPLSNLHEISWESSWLRNKLRHVLWIPIEAAPSIPIAERTIGTGILWQPSYEQEQALRQDWEELMDMICLGQLEQITAHHGKYLQIRPKAANASALRPASDEHGNRIMTLPRGFYLRPAFTRQILEAHFAID